ncbi:O-methyltransferase family protein [Umbelopsis sp. AD052]|nr:O-methyltransferase family protein [Umbelopsis sp. AD052]
MSSSGATFPKSILESLQAETRQRFRDAHKMIPLHQAEFLYSFTRMIRPENVLEIGTFTGMSTTSIAAGTQGRIITIERDSGALSIAKSWLEKAGMANRITFEEGIALDIVKKIPTGPSATKFDLVFIDADKGNYINYFNQIMSRSLLSDRGVILVDNVLFRGLVPQAMESEIDPQNKGLMRTARQLHAFNQHIKDDPRVEQIILPLYDGLSIIQKKAKLTCFPPKL